MDYPLSENNWICRTFGHRYGRMYTGSDWIVRQTCALDGKTIPPFRKVKQRIVAEGEDPYLPDDEQPFGAV
jgi:hypothetical protein